MTQKMNGEGQYHDPVVTAEYQLAAEELPPELREGYYDITLLYADEDRDDALKFKDVIQKFFKSGNKQATVCTISQNLTWLSSQITHLGEAIKRSNFAFLYITDSFRENGWALLQRDESIMASIQDDSESTSFTVPVFPNKCQKYKGLTGVQGRKAIDLYRLMGNRFMEDVNINALKLTDFDRVDFMSITRMLKDRRYLLDEREREREMAIQKLVDENATRCLREEVRKQVSPIVTRKQASDMDASSSDEETVLVKVVRRVL